MQKMVILFCMLLCMGMVLACPCAQAETADAPVLQVHQMMLGCADGYLIRLGDIDVMIDGGNANPALPTDDVINYLRAAGVDTLDAYIVTHWHLDHCMNLNKILNEFGSEDTIVYSPADRVPDKIFNGTVTVTVGPMIKGTHQQMKMGDVLELGDMTITCVGPEKLSQNGGCNQDSLNFVLAYGERKILFTGDFAASRSINNNYSELCSNVDILKFPHHALEPFEIGTMAMRTVRPEYVLVPGVVSKYKIWKFAGNVGVGIPQGNVFTNGDGHVVVLTDGGEYLEVLTQQNPVDYAPKAE